MMSYSTSDDTPAPSDEDIPDTNHVDENQSMFFGNWAVVRELEEEISLTKGANKDTESNADTTATNDVDTEKKEPQELKSGLDGSYWQTSNAHVTYSLTSISEFGCIDISLATPQYEFSKGWKFFGSARYQATVNELKDNLTDRGVIKCKRCCKTKPRGCADGCAQRKYITKEESSLPTVATNALLAMCLICAIEER